MSLWGGIKRTPADAAFSDFIRERAKWTCEYPMCFKTFNPLDPNQRKKIHCSHFKTRGNMRIRCDEDNAAAICAYHHDYLGKNPDKHTEFFMKRLGPRYWALIVRAETRRSMRFDQRLEAIRWKVALADLRTQRGEVIFGKKS